MSIPSLSAQEPTADSLLGAWDLEISAEDMVFELSFELQMNDGRLSGTISENSGFMSDVPFDEVAFEGAILILKFTAPTPPDGISRSIVIQMNLVEDGQLAGRFHLPEFDVHGQATASKKKL